jgi:hypothetical protein
MASPATNALSYNAYVTQIGVMAVVNTQEVSGVVQGVDAAFTAIIPQMLSYAELRIQRDLDLLPSLVSNGYALASGINQLQIPTSDFVTVQTLSVTSGTAQTPLLPVSKEFLQNVYNDSSYMATPGYFAMVGGDAATGGVTSNNVLVGPYPDSSYPVSVFGTARLPSLYQMATAGVADTGYTFISQWLPDLLIMASMIYISAFQRNFSSTGNDPQMPGSYELQYGNLLKGALVEEARKRFSASAWSSMSPPTVASPTRQ